MHSHNLFSGGLSKCRPHPVQRVQICFNSGVLAPSPIAIHLVMVAASATIQSLKGALTAQRRQTCYKLPPMLLQNQPAAGLEYILGDLQIRGGLTIKEPEDVVNSSFALGPYP